MPTVTNEAALKKLTYTGPTEAVAWNDWNFAEMACAKMSCHPLLRPLQLHLKHRWQLAARQRLLHCQQHPRYGATRGQVQQAPVALPLHSSRRPSGSKLSAASQPFCAALSQSEH